MSNKGRLPALGLGAKRPEQHALVQARLHSRHRYSLVLSFSLSLAILSSRSLLTKGVSLHPHSPSILASLSLSPLFCLSGTKNSTGTIRPPPAAAPHVILPLALISSAPLPRHLLHLFPSPALFIDVAVRSSLPFTVAGSTQVISIKDTAAGSRCSCYISCGSQPAGPWAHVEE